ncbi:hypothetical protein O4J56_15490 [Nocardiopsis sp. RSe5-2]|uniref:Type II toxin-antitoxin system HicB family antitoxin n=1 Tax=Nocardiopsis endophytica TaxID=3018445 RepID=A0ABT4U5Q4_9ACTN|nr:hypothetical protein [Nocardiopsis endophytica]MDA2812046.1 hypothetical protein [Nocardiopsis endophytica]
MRITLEQDEDGVWNGHAEVRTGHHAFGYGDDPADALADLMEGIAALAESEEGGQGPVTGTGP